MRYHHYYVYLVTNPKRTTLYIGVTNDLQRRLEERADNEGQRQTFAGRYFCNHFVHWEEFGDINQAIAREKELKGWRRQKKDALIASTNPDWRDLTNEIMA
ncbi:GIY-YIG nuclease family protein [Hymenobacter taeanensis]|uniref:GIY-YIG nuclease family protein n=1 Tax=Hymenobacter taeanensis TaxID=2735321 RepID=A0A6M6BIV9_9BACT|nr:MULTISPECIES: GIY-YIG nuclease family protein [Hymenobacter]QJX46995.1 GIY-YIG nuclease family protein [Hymenobacter taeanensis]UOQ80871.1 GIY-YIG nuclease family protein [Hymenobacter sp. 5414T-23]